jgi:hypothetical protein
MLGPRFRSQNLDHGIAGARVQTDSLIPRLACRALRGERCLWSEAHGHRERGICDVVVPLACVLAQRVFRFQLAFWRRVCGAGALEIWTPSGCCAKRSSGVVLQRLAVPRTRRRRFLVGCGAGGRGCFGALTACAERGARIGRRGAAMRRPLRSSHKRVAYGSRGADGKGEESHACARRARRGDGSRRLLKEQQTGA